MRNEHEIKDKLMAAMMESRRLDKIGVDQMTDEEWATQVAANVLIDGLKWVLEKEES